MDSTEEGKAKLGGPRRDARQDPPLDLMDLFGTLREKLERIVGGMGLTGADGSDVLQDVSVKVLGRDKAFCDEQQATRWLIRVVVNACLLEYRRRRSFFRALSERVRRRPARTGRSAEDEAIRAEEMAAVQHALEGLDGSLAMVLVLRYFCEFNSAQIGEILGVPASTVRASLSKARTVLAETLIARGMAP